MTSIVYFMVVPPVRVFRSRKFFYLHIEYIAGEKKSTKISEKVENIFSPLPYKAKEARRDAGLLSLVFHMSIFVKRFRKKIWGRPKPPPLLSSRVYTPSSFAHVFGPQMPSASSPFAD